MTAANDQGKDGTTPPSSFDEGLPNTARLTHTRAPTHVPRGRPTDPINAFVDVDHRPPGPPMYETLVTAMMRESNCGSCGGRRGAHALVTRLAKRSGDGQADSYGKRIRLEWVAPTMPAPGHAAALDEVSRKVDLVDLKKALGVREEGCFIRLGIG